LGQNTGGSAIYIEIIFNDLRNRNDPGNSIYRHS
jgi:hypothetical protein